jgi:hypothetical protein
MHEGRGERHKSKRKAVITASLSMPVFGFIIFGSLLFFMPLVLISFSDPN